MRETVPLKRLAEITYGLGQPPSITNDGVPILRATNISRGVINSDGMIFALKSDLPLARTPLLRTGEILVVRSGAYTGDSALITEEWGGASPGYDLRVTPRMSIVDSRYLAWSLLGERALEQIALLSSRAAQPHLNAEELGSVPIYPTDLEEQRRIADFLDDQVSRIDKAIIHRLMQLSLVRERLAAFLESILARSTGQRLLSSLTDPTRPIQYGIVLPGPDFDGGVPIVKGGDVAAHRMSPELLSRTDPAIEAGYPRSRLVAGDLLIAIRGSVGELAMVPPELMGANITQDAARIAPKGVDTTWLRWLLETPLVQGRIASRVTGATVRGINIGDLRRIVVPWVDMEQQVRLGREAAGAAGDARELTENLETSTALLRERKRALITAAVTGEFDVTAASRRSVE